MRTIFSLVLFLASLVSVSQELYTVDPDYPVHPLDTYLQFVEDVNSSLEPEQVLTGQGLSFKSRSDFPEGPRAFEVGSVYWARVKIISEEELEGWTLNFEDVRHRDIAWVRSNGKVDVWGYSDDQKIFHKKTGAGYPKSERDIKKKWLMNRVNFEISPDKEVTLIMRVEGNAFGMNPFFNTSLRHPDHANYSPVFPKHATFNVFLFGVTFIIFFYHLLLFLYTKEKVFLWFTVYALVCSFTQANTIGLGFEYLYSNYPGVRYPIFMCIAQGILITFWFFGRAYTNSRIKYPVLDKVILILTGVIALEIIFNLIWLSVGDPDIYYTNMGIHYKLIIMYAFCGLILAIVFTLKKDPFARYFGIGAIVASLSMLIGGMWSEGWFQPGFDPYAWGIFSQLIIYSFGIAFRRNRLDKIAEKERLQNVKAEAEIGRMRDMDTMKSRFFANISHEFRTPLTLITGPLKGARNKAKSNGSGSIELDEKNFSVIENNAKRLQNLVDQLLDLAKMEANQLHLKLEENDPIGFIRSVVFSFESMAERRNISLNTSFPEAIKNAYFDRDKLEKILTNLLSNAFKFSPDGGTVGVMIRDDEDYMVIEVSDTGKGIDPKDMDRIFDRFYRVESTEIKGSGIGLALTKELVDLHNGQISVNSTVGKGTVFKVRLPVSLSELPANAIINKGTVATDGELDSQPGTRSETSVINTASDSNDIPRVLIVEDNPDLRDYISGILEGQYEIILANNGLQGERLAFEHIPEIVITDVMMPKKDGFELCHGLKNNIKTSHIPVIMLTAKAGKENRIEGLSQGADAYLSKPFDPDELKIMVRNLLAARTKLWEHFKASDMLVVKDLELKSMDDEFLQKVIQEIRENLDNDAFSVEDLASGVGFSRSQLHRKLKAVINKSANQLITEVRLNEAKSMLENKAGSVSEIAYSVGFTNLSYFTKSFKEKFGTLPSKV